MDPTQILLNATSPDGATRNAAEAMLRDATSDLAGFLRTLVGVITSENSPPPARMMATIVLKNTVAVRSKDAVKKAALEAKWRGLSDDQRAHLKENILAALASPEKNVRFVVALLVANLARIEIPFDQWNSLLPTLCSVCGGENGDFAEAALLTLGYICEETEHCDDLDTAMQNASRPILDAIFNCMARPMPSVVYSATRCLVLSMDFIHHHMGVQLERDFIVKSLCDQCRSPDERTRERAMEGVFRLADLYYHLLPAYIGELATVTVMAIEGHRGNEGASIYAMQFWASICETETEMDPRDEEFKGITFGVRADLFRVMWQALQCQEEGQTNEDANISVAASRVLAFMATALRDEILPVAMDTAMNNVGSNQWRVQDAAIVLFGCIIPAPTPDRISSQVSGAIPALCGIACTGHENVRDSAGWVLSQIATYFPAMMFANQSFPNIFGAIKAMINTDPRLAERGLSVLHNLALYVDEYMRDDDDDDDDNGNNNARLASNELSPLFSEIVGCLGGILDNRLTPDNLRSIAQETLNVVIHAAARDVVNVLHSMVPILVGKIRDFVAQRNSVGATPYLNTQVALLCGAITAITRKLGTDMQRHAGDVLPAIHSTLIVPPSRSESIIAQTNADYEEEQSDAIKMAGVESVVCISALTVALDDAMWPHLHQFTPFILKGLSQTDDEDVYMACLGVVGDAARSFGPRANQVFLFEALGLLRDQLHSDATPITVKPDIMKCVGDVALWFKEDFANFAPPFLKITSDLDAAARALNLEDDDTRDNVIGIFVGIAVFCSQVLLGMKENLAVIVDWLPWMVNFAEQVGAKFTTTDPDLLEKLVAVVGDLACVVLRNAPPPVVRGAQQALGTQGIERLLRGAADFRQVESVSEMADWAMKQVSKLMARRAAA